MLQKCTIFKVAGVFFDEPSKSHSLMGISRDIKLAHTSVINHLTELIRLKIIKVQIEKKGKRDFPVYSANTEEESYKKYKKIYNLFKIEESGLVNYLKDRFMPQSVILFGTYSRGEDLKDSDIDLFVECKKQNIVLSAFEKKLNRKIELHFKEQFNDYPKELKNNIINGIVLSGYLEAY